MEINFIQFALATWSRSPRLRFVAFLFRGLFSSKPSRRGFSTWRGAACGWTTDRELNLRGNSLCVSCQYLKNNLQMRAVHALRPFRHVSLNLWVQAAGESDFLVHGRPCRMRNRSVEEIRSNRRRNYTIVAELWVIACVPALWLCFGVSSRVNCFMQEDIKQRNVRLHREKSPFTPERR